ncbi:MAG: glycerophosphodiester phosphodiesterase family protein [Pseudomonadota bacterium]
MSERRAPDWLTQWEYAHRGLHSDGVPENSLGGAEAAIAAGLGIECDIQRSLDDFPMVFHDWEVDRLTGQSGNTGSFLANELESMRLEATEQTPVRLGRLLDLVDGRVPILIEIKSRPDYDPDPTSANVQNCLQNYRGDFAVMSFDPRVAIWFRANAPDIPCGLVMREDEIGYTRTEAERRKAFEQAQPDFLAYHIAALPNPWVAMLRAKGLPIIAWAMASPECRARALDCADVLVSEGEGLA